MSADPIKQAPIPIVPNSASTLKAMPPKQEIDPKILAKASEFESMVLGQMLQPMFEALDSDGMFGGGDGERMFRPMLIEQYAQAMSKAGGVGIANEVAQEMMKMQTAQQDAATKPPVDVSMVQRATSAVGNR